MSDSVESAIGLFNDMLTGADAAALLGVGPQTLTLWRRQQKYLPFYQIGGVVKYKREDIEAYAQKCLEPIMPVEEVAKPRTRAKKNPVE